MDRLSELRTMPYEQYLQTPEWQQKREIMLRMAEYHCQICHESRDLNVHHSTYKRRGNEAWADLICLCQVCHELFHKAGRLPSPEDVQQERVRILEFDPHETKKEFSLARLRFDNFQREYQPGAYKIAQAFVNYLSNSTLVLRGSYGVGKTHLLAAMCNSLLERGISSAYLSAPLFFTYLQNHPHIPVIEQLVQVPFLVIDNVDIAKRSDFREEMYYSIIDKRVQNDLPIALSTNRLAELPDFIGQACFSRLRVGLIEIEMVGEDYRGRL